MRAITAHARIVIALSILVAIACVAVLALWREPGLPSSFEMRQFESVPPHVMERRRRLERLFPGRTRPLLVIAYRASTPKEAFERAVQLKPLLRQARKRGEIADFYSPVQLYGSPETYRKNHKLVRARLTDLPVVENFDAAVRAEGRNPEEFQASREFLTLMQETLSDPRLADDVGDLSASIWTHSIAPSAGEYLGVIPLAISPHRSSHEEIAKTIENLNRRLDRVPGRWASLNGWAILEHEIKGVVKIDFVRITLAGAIAVILICLVFFRSIRDAALALLPISLGLILMGAVMKLLGFTLNYLSIAAFPLVIGIGIDDGIHLLHRYRTEGRHHLVEAFASSGRAVVLTSLTNLFAFGSFILSWNEGFQSLGFIMIFGITATLVVSLVTLPAVLALVDKNR